MLDDGAPLDASAEAFLQPLELLRRVVLRARRLLAPAAWRWGEGEEAERRWPCSGGEKGEERKETREGESERGRREKGEREGERERRERGERKERARALGLEMLRPAPQIRGWIRCFELVVELRRDHVPVAEGRFVRAPPACRVEEPVRLRWHARTSRDGWESVCVCVVPGAGVCASLCAARAARASGHVPARRRANSDRRFCAAPHGFTGSVEACGVCVPRAMVEAGRMGGAVARSPGSC